jgi:hypothetical protein
MKYSSFISRVVLFGTLALGLGAGCDRGSERDEGRQSQALSACAAQSKQGACGACIAGECCAERSACMNDADCAHGGPDGSGEITCHRACLAEPAASSASCDVKCAGKGKSSVGPATAAITGCIAARCGTACPSS